MTFGAGRRRNPADIRHVVIKRIFDRCNCDYANTAKIPLVLLCAVALGDKFLHNPPPPLFGAKCGCKWHRISYFGWQGAIFGLQITTSIPRRNQIDQQPDGLRRSGTRRKQTLSAIDPYSAGILPELIAIRSRNISIRQENGAEYASPTTHRNGRRVQRTLSANSIQQEARRCGTHYPEDVHAGDPAGRRQCLARAYGYCAGALGHHYLAKFTITYSNINAA